MSRETTAHLPHPSSPILEEEAKTPAQGVISAAKAPLPLPMPRPVALRGKMTPDGYVPENWAWLDVLTCPNGKSSKGQRRDGRDPMSILPAVLTQAGHPPRRTRAIIKALGDEPIAHDMRRCKDLRKHCLDCSAGSRAGVRRCAIINCPLWAYRMGRNPHNPKRGRNPFVNRQHDGEQRHLSAQHTRAAMQNLDVHGTDQAQADGQSEPFASKGLEVREAGDQPSRSSQSALS